MAAASGWEGTDFAELARERMAAWDAVLKSAFRVPPYNPDALIAGRGYETYENMMTDAMVRAAVNTKRFALLSRPWQVFAAANSGERPNREQREVRDFVEACLRGMRGPGGAVCDFRSVLFQMMSAFYRGFSLAEVVWRVEERGRWAGKFVLASVKAKPPKQVGFEVDDFLNVTGITGWTPQGGPVRVPREKVLLYIYNPRDELPHGDSDLRAVYKHWWSKEVITKFWSLSLQKHGMPMIFVEGTAGADVDGLMAHLRAIQNDSIGVFPHNSGPQLLQASQAGAEAFGRAIDYHNEQIAQGILLQTLTSGEGRRVGSMALGQVHFDILLYALENARTDIEGVVNAQLVRPLVDYNFGGAEERNLYPSFSMGAVNQKDIAKLAQAYDVLLRHGVVTGREQAVRDVFDLPPAEESKA